MENPILEVPAVFGNAKRKTGRVKSSDIYQLLSYTLAHETPGLLVYPALEGDVTTTYEVDGQYDLTLVELPTNLHADSYLRFVRQLKGASRSAIRSATE